jgi:hypothetical protein
MTIERWDPFREMVKAVSLMRWTKKRGAGWDGRTAPGNPGEQEPTPRAECAEQDCQHIGREANLISPVHLHAVLGGNSCKTTKFVTL